MEVSLSCQNTARGGYSPRTDDVTEAPEAQKARMLQRFDTHSAWCFWT